VINEDTGELLEYWSYTDLKRLKKRDLNKRKDLVLHGIQIDVVIETLPAGM